MGKKTKVKRLVRKFLLSLLFLMSLSQSVQASEVWCWGHNGYGQLGDGTTTNRLTPVQVKNLSGVVQVATGYSHTCALKQDSTVWCWGDNYHGQLGDGTVTNRLTPVQVKNLSGVVQVTAGYYHTCALKQDGTVWCWGDNYHGQLGDGTIYDRPTPVQVKNLTGVVQIAGGGIHTCALEQDGTVWCWGDNRSGQLGDGTTSSKLTPIQVQNLTGVVQVAGGGRFHTCALRQDGTAWCWGNNNFGQLGDGTTTNRYTPVQVQNLTGVVQVAGGYDHTCALRQDGTVWCWGHNVYGKLGDGTTTNRYTPVQVSGLIATLIFDGRSIGGFHSCAIANLSQITLSPESISFTKPGETRKVTVSNSGVTITSVTSSDPKIFQIKNNTCTNSSRDCSFDVVFKPEQLIDYTGTITVSYNGGSKTVSLQALLSKNASAPVACSKPPTSSQPIERKPGTAFVIITQVGECK